MSKKKRLKTSAEMGRDGGKNRWKGVSKEERSKIMRKTVMARYNRVPRSPENESVSE